MKDRLIELIEQAKFCSTEELADYLIAAGLVLPKEGRWIIHHPSFKFDTNGIEYANGYAVCSECQVCGNPMWKVCPVCETRMVIEND